MTWVSAFLPLEIILLILKKDAEGAGGAKWG